MYGVPAVASVSPGAGPIPQVGFQQPTNLFRFGEQTIWSTQMYQAGAIANTTNRIFTTPQGQQGQGFTAALSIAETNLKQGGQVPGRHRIRCVWRRYRSCSRNCGQRHWNPEPVHRHSGYHSVPTERDSQHGSSVGFHPDTNRHLPRASAGAGGGAFGAVAQNAAGANSGHMNNGNGNIWMYQKHPVALPGQTTFAIQLRVGSRAAAVANNSVTLRVVLLGYYKNVIEIG